MTGVKTQPESLAAPGRLEQSRQLVDRATERPARARRVLQVKRAALALGERLPDRLAGTRHRLGGIARLG